MDFLRKLENKFSGDWISGQMPNDRVMAMNKITAAIDEINTPSDLSLDQKIDQLLVSPVFEYDRFRFFQILETEALYGRRFARYLLFKLDTLYASPDSVCRRPP